MEKNCFKYGVYDIYPSGQQYKNEDGSLGKWKARAEIVRSGGNKDLLVPVTWPNPEFGTEQEAQRFAMVAAKELINSGRCEI